MSVLSLYKSCMYHFNVCNSGLSVFNKRILLLLFYVQFNNVVLNFTEYTISRSSNNSNNVGSMCNMSGQCAWPGLQLNYFLHSSSSHNRMGTNSARLQLNN